MTLAAVLVPERVLEAEALLGAGDDDGAVQRQQLVNREIAEVVVTVAGVEHEVLRVGILGVAAVADHQVAVAAIHQDGVESQEASIPRSADHAFGNGAVAGREILRSIASLGRRLRPLEGQLDVGVGPGRARQKLQVARSTARWPSASCGLPRGRPIG